MPHPLSSDSVLFDTLDSCRYDTFVRSALPRMKALGPLRKALAPLLNPTFGKRFKFVGAGFAGKGTEGFHRRLFPQV